MLVIFAFPGMLVLMWLCTQIFVLKGMYTEQTGLQQALYMAYTGISLFAMFPITAVAGMQYSEDGRNPPFSGTRIIEIFVLPFVILTILTIILNVYEKRRSDRVSQDAAMHDSSLS